MKTLANGGMKFGFSAVNTGQRAMTYEPQLIVSSTKGNFRITSPVSKLLGIQHGEHVMFLSNVNDVDVSIFMKDEDLVAFCEQNGLDIESPEAKIAIHREFDAWAIAKGIQEFDSKGNAKTTFERLTKKDKIKFIEPSFEERLAAALDEENGAPAEVKDALTREGITREEQIEILADFVKPRELQKYRGSKTANPAGLTGVGVTLNFTDSNVWKQLKVGMGEDATKMNRIFNLDIEDVQEVVLNDGYKDVTIKALVLKGYTDKVPAKAGKGEEVEEIGLEEELEEIID